MTEFWQDSAIGFGLGVTAYGATNVDNFLLLGSLIAGGARRASVAAGFAGATGLIVLVAMSFSALAYFMPPAALSYLGLVPVGLGLRVLFHPGSGPAGAAQLQTNAVSVAVILLANSLDTVATLAPMFAESEMTVRLALIAGIATAAVVLFSVVLRFAQRLSTLDDKGPITHRIAGVIMILVGIYVLFDTGTDLEYE